jgi:hypothetical protein
LNKNAFSLDRVDVGSKIFFTSAQGIQPQVINTLFTEKEGFHIHQSPTYKVLHACYTQKLPFSCHFKIISSGLNLQNIYKCCTSSISWSTAVNQSPLQPTEYCTGHKNYLLRQKRPPLAKSRTTPQTCFLWSLLKFYLWKYNITKDFRAKKKDKTKMFNMRFNMMQFNMQYTYTLEIKYKNWRDVSTVFWGWMGPTLLYFVVLCRRAVLTSLRWNKVSYFNFVILKLICIFVLILFRLQRLKFVSAELYWDFIYIVLCRWAILMCILSLYNSYCSTYFI